MSDKKNNRGAPPKYNDDTEEEYNRQAYELALLGLTDAQIAPVLGIAKSTLNEWKKKFPKFSDSIRQGKTIADAQVAKSLHKSATGFTALEVEFKNVDLTEGLLVGFDLENMSPYELLNLGQLLKVEDAVLKVKNVAPNANAATRWLANRRREDWKLNPDRQPEEDPLQDVPIVYELHTGDGNYIEDTSGQEEKDKQE